MPASPWRVALGVVLVLVAAGCGSRRVEERAVRVGGPPTLHYSDGTSSDQPLALSLGFDLMDIAGGAQPARTKDVVDSLPRGVRALIWVGNLDNTDCATPGYSAGKFRALVDELANDPKVFGWYLADEPHPGVCANAVADIRARADYLHAHSSFQKAFIVVQDGDGPCGSHIGCEFEALQPSRSGVDLVGLDPYPCHYSSDGEAAPCNFELIRERVAAALGHGIPADAIVPLFQVFGQQGRRNGTVYYRLPTADELGKLFATWADVVPNPVLDYVYGFGVQCAATCPAPQALSNEPGLQPLVRAHNRPG